MSSKDKNNKSKEKKEKSVDKSKLDKSESKKKVVKSDKEVLSQKCTSTFQEIIQIILISFTIVLHIKSCLFRTWRGEGGLVSVLATVTITLTITTHTTTNAWTRIAVYNFLLKQTVLGWNIRTT